ncbi:hypothetical protein [Haloarchaeobius litoreus]|uniref:Uncharacterized protein n=1 Tax=Haloarchaeobius litoreus TaxID=755306 RepID=A0ABD6DLH5_9EURY|nr:hypothetical protein [Haloarchaeobius litoreus]
MSRRLRSWLSGRFGGESDGEDDSTDDESETGRFVPSPLDLSVRFAHGSGDSNVDRELTKVHDEARRLDEERRRD